MLDPGEVVEQLSFFGDCGVGRNRRRTGNRDGSRGRKLKRAEKLQKSVLQAQQGHFVRPYAKELSEFDATLIGSARLSQLALQRGEVARGRSRG